MHTDLPCSSYMCFEPMTFLWPVFSVWGKGDLDGIGVFEEMI